MWLANVVGKVPFWIRLAFVAAVFAFLLIMSGPVIFNHLGFFLVLLFLLFFDRIVARTETKPQYVADVVAVVQRDGDYLQVQDKRILAAEVQRVAVGSDGRRGYLQFPFNPKFGVRLVFPNDQVGPLSLHIKTLLPEVTLVD